MKIILDQKDFYGKLEMVGRVSAKHVTLPVLQCVYLEAKDDHLVMRATNLEIAIEANVSASVAENGVIAVPASVLLQTVSLNNEKSVTLRAEDGGLVVEASGSETLIKSIPHEEFPSIPKVEGGGQTINNHLFSLGIKSSAFAASVSSLHEVLDPWSGLESQKAGIVSK